MTAEPSFAHAPPGLAALPLPDGVRIVVPDRLDRITPFVLREQGDWFEAEIRFVRMLARPGMNAVDVGANYGVYALSLAARVGPGGRVWAFEPSPATAEYLRAGVAANRFDNVAVLEAALSDRCGSSEFELNDQAELSRLAPAQQTDGRPARRVSVALTTLDQALREHGWPEIDFLKLDAEGEEARIVTGGAAMLADQSPLVMFEIRHCDGAIDTVAGQSLARLGYQLYELCPGLQVLAPVAPDRPVDGFQLNLFACKPDRARRLERLGLVVPAGERIESPGRVDAAAGWRALETIDCSPELVEQWRIGARVDPDRATPLLEVIALYACARDRSREPAERWAAARTACERASALCAAELRPEHLCVYGRIAAELGHRQSAIAALSTAMNQLAAHPAPRLALPFLPASERFDAIEPRGDPARWALAGVIEQLQTLRHHSAFFGAGGTELIDALRELGFATPAMERRRAAIQARALAAVLA